jgi:hypothetical protein
VATRPSGARWFAGGSKAPGLFDQPKRPGTETGPEEVELRQEHDRTLSNRMDDIEQYLDDLLQEKLDENPDWDPTEEEFEAVEEEAERRWAAANGYGMKQVGSRQVRLVH